MVPEMYKCFRSFFLLVFLVCPLLVWSGPQETLRIEKQSFGFQVKSEAHGFRYQSRNSIQNARILRTSTAGEKVFIWEEGAPGRPQTRYLVESSTGKRSPILDASYLLKLRHDQFDPLQRTPNVIDLRTGPPIRVYIVQFHTQPLESYRQRIRELGGEVYGYLANYAHLVKMEDPVRDAVNALPFVRWVGAYQPAFRVEEFILENLGRAESVFPLLRYNIQLFYSDAAVKQGVGNRILALGGAVDSFDAGKHLIEATLTPEQLFELLNWDEVVFVDRWSPIETDMDVVREISGANTLETLTGYTGLGVRGEVLDSGFNTTHVDFASRPLIEHTPTDVTSHGSSTSGIVFGDGTGNALARGLLPDGQGIIADSGVVFVGPNRYTHTGELLESPYFAVFQTASVGSSRTLHYTTISMDTDEALFDFDILHCQSQSNALWRHSRPQAWAKNIVSGGGFRHFNTLDRSDDCWGCSTTGASIGPSSDGRIKPDLSHFYDSTFTVTSGSNTAYTNFGGTSGATPIICGHIGLFFQMWSEGVFGNTIDLGGTVFENRSHLSTAKAMMINSANQSDFSGSTHDMSRFHQGWGMPDVDKLYSLRSKMLIVDETDLIENLETRTYTVMVSPAEPEFRATLVYLDPPGLPASTQHRINDLSLRVTSPSGARFWGNHGLTDGNFSKTGGGPNQVDTVENVWVPTPEPGKWLVEVIAFEINQDSHVETPELDADFALVVSGVQATDPALTITLPDGLPAEVDADVPLDITVGIFEGSETLMPGSPTLYFRSYPNAPFTAIAMTSLGNDLYQATLPRSLCIDQPEFYFGATGHLGSDVVYPSGAPSGSFSIDVGKTQFFFTDDFETDQGWTSGAGDDDATSGFWERVNPLAKRTQPQTDHTPGAGQLAFITGQESDNGSSSENDIDNGKTTLISPLIDLQGVDAVIAYRRWFSNNFASTSPDDTLVVDISDDDGANWVNVETIGPTGPGTTGSWIYHEFLVSDFITPSSMVRVRFVASDTGNSSTVEAGVDDFQVKIFECVQTCSQALFEDKVAQWPFPNVLGLISLICD